MPAVDTRRCEFGGRRIAGLRHDRHDLMPIDQALASLSGLGPTHLPSSDLCTVSLPEIAAEPLGYGCRAMDAFPSPTFVRCEIASVSINLRMLR